MSEKAKKSVLTLILIGIVILVVISIRLNTRLNNLEWSLNNINANYLQLYNEINTLRWDISNRIDLMSEQVEQNAKQSFDETFLIQNYNTSDSTADVEISFCLKEYTVGETINVTARGQGGQAFSAMATLSDTGRFFAGMTLPVQDNYILMFTTEGETIRSGELMRLDLADNLIGWERFRYNLSSGSSSGGNQPSVFSLHPDFINNSHGNDALLISKISLSIESGEDTVITWDLLPYLQNMGITQELVYNGDNWNEFQINIGSGIREIEPNSWIVVRLDIRDNLGVRYVRTDPAYVSSNIGASGGGGGGTVSASSPAPPAADDAGNAWGVFRIVG
jgi:hypothetical protein